MSQTDPTIYFQYNVSNISSSKILDALCQLKQESAQLRTIIMQLQSNYATPIQLPIRTPEPKINQPDKFDAT